jgi:uncharacterized LabA/DUF88 family protein
MKRIGLFVDIGNLWYHTNRAFNKKVDYKKYIEYVERMGSIYRATAYGSQVNGNARGFITALKSMGYDTRYKEPKTLNDGRFRYVDWTVGMAMDVVRVIDSLDVVVLGSASSELSELALWIKERGVSVTVLACEISQELRDVSNKCIEINSEVLEVKVA